MAQVIVWADSDGRVSVTTPAEGASIEAVLQSGIVPEGATPFVIDTAQLPPDASQSHTWRLSPEGTVTVDAAAPPAQIIVPKGRVKLELIDRGIYAELKALALAMGPAGEVFWADFVNWESDHWVVLQLAGALGEPLDAWDVHEVFAAARDRNV